ncbi:MAG TPA: hypothetical protein PKD86_18055 [Gemmatales bacterium]|nr:hypothetical protein [Gemmatales bacterium]HMP61253.1 hypothetical protein [Gemmatales bacterium]
MHRANYLFWILFALIAGLLAAMLTHQFMTRDQTAPVPTRTAPMMFVAEVVPVVVAALPVPGNIVIDDPGRWFRVIRIAKDDAPRDAIADFGAIRGQYLRRPLGLFQPVLKPDLVPPPASATPAATPPTPTPPAGDPPVPTDPG